MGNVVFDGIGAIANFGILAAIGALFLFIFYIQFKNYWKQMMKYQDERDKQNKMLIEHFVEEMNSKSKNLQKVEVAKAQEEHQKNLELRMSLSRKINDIIYELRHKINASRIYVTEFHNSNSNLSGMPFAKFSCTYESTRYGISNVMNVFSNFPFSSISNIVHEVLLSGEPYVIYDDIEIIKDTSQIIYNMLADTTKQIGYFGLYNSGKSMLGFVVVEFSEEGQFENIDIEDIETAVSDIQHFIDLEQMLKNKNNELLQR